MNSFSNDSVLSPEYEDIPPHIARVLEMITDAFVALDPQDCYLYLNREAERLLGRSRKELLGHNIWAAFPQEADSEFRRAIEHARAERSAVTCLNHAVTLGRWLENKIFPATDGMLFVYFRDVTAAKLADEQLHQMNAELSRTVEEFQTLFDLFPVPVLVASDPECQQILANPAGRKLFNVAEDENISMSAPPAEKTAAFRVVRGGVEVAAEELPMQVAAATGKAIQGTECQLICADGREIFLYGYASPLFGEDGQTRGSIGAFVDATPMKRMEQQLQARAEREALLNRIAQALTQSAGPEAAQKAAVGLLGEALSADRCYIALYRMQESVLTVTQDWSRADLESLQGSYLIPDAESMFEEFYQDVGVSMIPDTETTTLSAETREKLKDFGLRARLSVLLADDAEYRATLTVAMTDRPRRWTFDEITLLQMAANQLRNGVEVARTQQHERRIAEQLQEALLPAIPAQIPGMRISFCYRAALQEAGVGGDFAQVFSVDPSVSYLLVGDLAGKGLAAASQIAVVTNMIRFAVRDAASLADAVNRLNTVLAEESLISGFATLFVGRFDAATRRLTYVNCGQDAGLILRQSTGDVQPLPPTGPVLGAIGGVIYQEQSVSLEPGDVLALYTDGLTEAGATRQALLTGDGVAELLRGLRGIKDVEMLVSRLMAGVDAFAAHRVRDDQCLLAALVMPAD